MNILVTGAWQATEAQLARLREMGHDIFLQKQESAPPVCDYDLVEGVICNGLFLHHPLERFPRLRYIQLTSAGFDRLPVEEARERGIAVYNARGVYSIPMAEHALAGVLSLYRRLPEFRELQKQRKWEKIRDLEELSGRKALILGCGSVGTEVAARFSAMGCRIAGVDIVAKPSGFPFDEVLPLEKLEEKLPGADILILTLPLTSETRGLLDAGRLRLLKDHAVVVNISRGAVVEQNALEKELVSGRLRAVLDVFEEEPLAEESPLWGNGNVVLTPHNSFCGNGNAERLGKLIFHNLERFV